MPGNDEPGQANLAICSSAVGQRYKCLAFTLEMPFKDTDYAREPVQVECNASVAVYDLTVHASKQISSIIAAQVLRALADL